MLHKTNKVFLYIAMSCLAWEKLQQASFGVSVDAACLARPFMLCLAPHMPGRIPALAMGARLSMYGDRLCSSVSSGLFQVHSLFVFRLLGQKFLDYLQ